MALSQQQQIGHPMPPLPPEQTRETALSEDALSYDSQRERLQGAAAYAIGHGDPDLDGIVDADRPDAPAGEDSHMGVLRPPQQPRHPETGRYVA
jgi:hypothetical protein